MNQIKIATATALLVLSPAILSEVAVSADDSETSPNIVLFFVDDLGWGEWAYRPNSLGTPNIDRLAQQGVTFRNAYSASPTCSPSRASVLTGRHPARLRIVRHVFDRYDPDDPFTRWGGDPAKMPSRNWLPLEETTIAEALKPLGYDTAFVGKWHLGHEPYFPVHNGYDVQFGVSTAGHPKSYFAPYFGDECQTYRHVPQGKYLTDQLTDDAVAYIRNRDGERPFLLTLFYYSAHDPFQAPEELLDKLRKEHPGKRVTPLAGMIASVDGSVGRIRKTLTEKGLDSNTIICLLGDQGGKRPMPPLRGTKKGGQALYEGGARVPFIVRGPGVAQPGTRSSQIVTTNDVFPTLLEMAGGSSADFPDLDGVSLAGVLRGEGPHSRRQIFLYRSYEDQYAAVRSDRWKLIAYRSGRCELYDIEADLSEADDLAAERPDKVEQLKSALRTWEKEMGVPGELSR